MRKLVSKFVIATCLAGIIITGAGRKNVLADSASVSTNGGRYGTLKYDLTVSGKRNGGSLYWLYGSANQDRAYNGGQGIRVTSMEFNSVIPLIGGGEHKSDEIFYNRVDESCDFSVVPLSSVNFGSNRGWVRFKIVTSDYGTIDHIVYAD